MCVLVFAAQVASARAEDAPQPPVIPAVPTVAVQVSVSIPSVSVIVQTGTVDVSVSTPSVDVSVAVSSEGSVSSTEAAAAAPQQTTQDDGSGNCCDSEAKKAASAATSAKATRAPAKPPARPTIRAAANGVRAGTTRVPVVESPTRSLAATQVPRPASERPATRPKALRGCCEDARAGVVIAATAQGPAPRPRAGLRPDRDEAEQVRPAAALLEEHVRDNRLLLQLGVLGAFLYLVCLAGWFSATTLRRRRA